MAVSSEFLLPSNLRHCALSDITPVIYAISLTAVRYDNGMRTGLAIFALLLGVHTSLLGQKPPQAATARPLVRVPFVGCASDGQVGAIKAPYASNYGVRVSAEAAQRVAYYKAKDGFGVLAPRGWHCFGTYGSNGASLYVSPDPLNGDQLLSTNWKGFTGPAIQISSSIGDTSGRFEVAKIIARVFPAYKQFVENVIAEGIRPASSFPFGPFPQDQLTYRSKRIVEYETPANADGLGTASWLLRNGHPISGLAILYGEEPNLLQLSLRLPPDSVDLAPVILHETEREAARLDAADRSQR